MDPKLREANEKLTEAICDALRRSTVKLCESLNPEEIRTQLEVILTRGQYEIVFNKERTPTPSNMVQTILGYLKSSENSKYFAFREVLAANRPDLVEMYLPDLQVYVDAVNAAKPPGSRPIEARPANSGPADSKMSSAPSNAPLASENKVSNNEVFSINELNDVALIQKQTGEANVTGRGSVSLRLVALNSKAVCRIRTESDFGSGFLVTLCPTDGVTMQGLMTCDHVISRDYLLKNKSFSAEFECINIKLTITPSACGYKFTCTLLDVTFIELNTDDLQALKHAEFLTPSTEVMEKDSVFILQHPDGGEATIGTGLVKIVHGSMILHQVDTEGGSSGSPVMGKDGKVIAIHNSYKGNQHNGATIFKHILRSIKIDYERPWLPSEPQGSRKIDLEQLKKLTDDDICKLRKHGLEPMNKTCCLFKSSKASSSVLKMVFHRTSHHWHVSWTDPEAMSTWNYMQITEKKLIREDWTKEKHGEDNYSIIRYLASNGGKYLN